MSLYNSFSRLGRKLDHSLPLKGLAWPWQNYDGVQPQSYQEWMITKEQNVPMAWVWSGYKSIHARFEPMPEDRNQKEVAPLEDCGAMHNVQDRESVIVSLQDHLITMGGIDRPGARQTADDDEISYRDILKLVASFVFAALVIKGVFLIPVNDAGRQKSPVQSQIDNKIKNTAVMSAGSQKK